MNDLYFIILLVMLFGAILSEFFSLIFIDRILVSYEQEPEKILEDKLLQKLSLLSLFYIISLFMLFFSGVERFALYGLVIGVATLLELTLRKLKKGRTLRVAIGSALSLMLLIDAFRKIIIWLFF